MLLDEPIASLDVSIQAGIINLLEDLQVQLKISYLFVAHDLAVIRHISDTVAVMHLGKIVEYGDTEEVFTNPQDPYQGTALRHPHPRSQGRAHARAPCVQRRQAHFRFKPAPHVAFVARGETSRLLSAYA